MAARDIISAFDDCINRLNVGETVTDCLDLYPQFARQLGPMLDTGRLVERARIDDSEVQAAQARARIRVEEALRTAPPPSRDNTLPFRRLATLAASVIFVLGLFLGGTGLAAEGSLPGDPLYSFKRFTENVRLTVFDDNLSQIFAQRRIDEIQQLLALNRAEAVDFTGEIEAIDGISWQIAGLPVIVPANTPGASDVRVRDIVTVLGQTTSAGTLVADEIQLRESGDIIPTATPTPASTNTPLPSGTPSPTIQPTVNSTPSPVPASAPEECVPTAPPGWITYSVRAGDALATLANITGVTIEQLMEVNCLEDPRRLAINQQLFLPSQPPENVGGSGGNSGNSGRGSGSSDDDDDG